MILGRQMLAMRGMLGLVRRPRGGVQRANEPYAAMAQAGGGTGLTTEQITQWMNNLGKRQSGGVEGYYRTSVPVYRAIKLRSDAVARTRLKVYRQDSDDELEWVGEDDPVQGLLDRVNQDWTRLQPRRWPWRSSTGCFEAGIPEGWSMKRWWPTPPGCRDITSEGSFRRSGRRSV